MGRFGRAPDPLGELISVVRSRVRLVVQVIEF